MLPRCSQVLRRVLRQFHQGSCAHSQLSDVLLPRAVQRIDNRLPAPRHVLRTFSPLLPACSCVPSYKHLKTLPDFPCTNVYVSSVSSVSESFTVSVIESPLMEPV